MHILTHTENQTTSEFIGKALESLSNKIQIIEISTNPLLTSRRCYNS